jgi:hypothetical protein
MVTENKQLEVPELEIKISEVTAKLKDLITDFHLTVAARIQRGQLTLSSSNPNSQIIPGKQSALEPPELNLISDINGTSFKLIAALDTYSKNFTKLPIIETARILPHR